MAHCTDAFSRGWTHMIQQLFQPFRLVFWLKMALLALLLGGPSTFRFNFPGGGFSGSNSSTSSAAGSGYDQILTQITENIAIISLVFIAILVFGIVFGFLHSCARFFFYEGILNGVVYFGDSWRRNSSQIIVYFLWNIVVGIIFSILIIVLVALAILALGLLGFSSSEPSIGIIILLVTLGMGFALILILLGILYTVLLDGIVVPQMLVKKMGIFQAWSIAIRLFLENLLEFVGFLLIRLAVGIVSFMLYFFAAMFLGVMSMLVMLPIFGLPSSDSSLPFIVMTVLTIVLVLPGVYIINFIFLPISVFNSSYSLSFLAGIARDSSFEPQDRTVPSTQPSPGTHPFYSGPTPATPMAPTPPPTEGGPISFRDIPEHTMQSSPAVPPYEPPTQPPTTPLADSAIGTSGNIPPSSTWETPKETPTPEPPSLNEEPPRTPPGETPPPSPGV